MDLRIALNAWTGSAAATGEVVAPDEWALGRPVESAVRLLAPRNIDLRVWQDDAVGWGIVLAEGARIPESLRALIAQRKGSVFSFIKDWEYSFTLLRNYAAGKDISINAAPRGMAADALPQYLLIYGTPQEVPWELQYVLNANRYVGRMHLSGAPADNYIEALMSDQWGDSTNGAARQEQALIWAVNHGRGDITTLMRDSIAAPLAEEMREDSQLAAGTRFIDGTAQNATLASLLEALQEQRPGLIVTTSHGMTGPLDDKARMTQDLGLLVDHSGAVLLPDALLKHWAPGGAVWYAHACCSAGASDNSRFLELVKPGSTAAQVLAAVAAIGPRVSPLPTALLGCKAPLRAFIGHVEPTFDWTLQQIATGQYLTDGVVEALYGNLYVQAGDTTPPISHAFREWYGRTGGLRALFDVTKARFNHGEEVNELLAATQLAARDVESTVILGDPTVAIPGLA